MITRIKPASLPEPKGHYSPAIVHNGIVYVSGQLPLIEGRPCSNYVGDQAKLCLENMETILLAAFSDRSQVLKLNVYISDMSYWDVVNTICAEFFGDHKPARAIITSGTLHHRCLIEIDCIAAQIQ
jgi:2-iminobutanoate/2-iminopropanoate deaminase